MIRRAAIAAALATFLIAGVASAAAPSGPRLAIVKLSKARMELLSVNPEGADPVHLAGGGRRARPWLDFFSPVSWSSDGAVLAFAGIVAVGKGDDHEPIQKIFTVGAGGGGLRPVRGTEGASGPVLSPDGHTVAVTRGVERDPGTRFGGKLWEEGFASRSVWTVDLVTGARRQLTRWENGVAYTASSFSPDGATLLATHEGPLLSDPEPVALAVDGSGSRRVFEDGDSPVFSPDGTRIAFLRSTMRYEENPQGSSDLYLVNADGTGLRRLTRTPGRAEFFPSWDPSGERLAYVRFSAAQSEAAAFGVGNALMQVNADGTCQTRVASSPRMGFYAPTWQPGADRAAGRIEC